MSTKEDLQNRLFSDKAVQHISHCTLSTNEVMDLD